VSALLITIPQMFKAHLSLPIKCGISLVNHKCLSVPVIIGASHTPTQRCLKENILRISNGAIHIWDWIHLAQIRASVRMLRRRKLTFGFHKRQRIS
jgi:hypothetical protein